MTALRAAIGPLLIAGSTVGAAWLLIWGFSFGGRFECCNHTIHRLVGACTCTNVQHRSAFTECRMY